MVVQTQYATSCGLDIAYQVIGDSGPAIIILPGLVSHVELLHDFPGYTTTLRRLSRFARVITFDKRGQGLSEGIHTIPTISERVEDVIAVLDAVGAERAFTFGFSEGGPITIRMAVDYPDRVAGMILFGSYAKATASRSYPHMKSAEQRRQALHSWLSDWGTGGGAALGFLAPEISQDDLMRKVFARIERFTATPNAMRRYFEANFTIDVLDILSQASQPALVLHRDDDQQVPVSSGRYLAEALPNSTFRHAGTGGHLFWHGDIDAVIAAVHGFVCADATATSDHDQAELTIMFSDIVNSTMLQVRLGDGPWRDLVDRHDEIAASAISLNRGRWIKSTGDGLLAVFDRPESAVEAAFQISEKVAQIGLDLRIGLNSGFVELRDQDIGGIAVNAAARIERIAEPGQILVSHALAESLTGHAGVTLSPAGTYALKGLDGEWPLYIAER